MLRLRIELVPHGLGEPRQIGCAVIGQTAPAGGSTYRYAASVWDDLDLTTPVSVAVDHDRTDGLWRLVHAVVETVLAGDGDHDLDADTARLLHTHLQDALDSLS